MKQAKHKPPHSRTARLENRHVDSADNSAQNEQVKRALEPLVRAGCYQEHLLDLLSAIKVAHEMYDRNRPGNEYIPAFTFDGHFGFDRKSFKTVLERMRQCAKDVETLSRKLGSGRLLEIFKMKLWPHQRAAHDEHLGGRNAARLAGFVVPEIPEVLFILADAVEEEAKQATFRKRPLYDDAVEALLRYVRESTTPSHWYYEKVATLLRIAVTLGDTPDGASLRVWARSRLVLRSLSHKS